MNIVDVIDRRARSQPHAVAFVTPSLAIGYAEAAERIRRIAAALGRHGVLAGQRVAVRLPNSPSHVLAVLALMRLGAVPVPLHPKRPAADTALLAQQIRLSATVGSADGEPIAGTQWIAMGDDMLIPADPAQHGAPNAAGDDSVALLALTSGTTGQSKAVAWSHRLVIRHWELMQRLVPHGPGVRLLVFMGLDGQFPLQAALRMLLAGGTVLLTPTVSPASLFDAVERLGATEVLASGALLSSAMQGLTGDSPRLPGLACLRVGGSQVSPALLARLRRHLTPNVDVTYGSTESGMLAMGSGAMLDRAPFSVGQLAPWVELKVVDEEGQEVGIGTSGRLRYRCDYFPGAYDGEVADTDQVFVDGWYQPGDVGRLLADGTLVLEGRADDIINIGGTKIRPAETEDVLLQDPSIVEAAVYAVPGPEGEPRLLAAVVCAEGFDEQASLARCRQVLGQRAPYRLVRLAQLPRNANGKVIRSELVARTRISRASEAAG